jgi:CheY-like chemotaxis protein
MPTAHILIADDNDNVRAFLARAVARIYPTAQLTIVPNGAAALAAFGTHPADLIITNARMPVLMGLDLVRTLRARHETVPILVLSADERLGPDALAAGADRFLAKPLALDAFRETLLALLPYERTG